jgi:hypothetical protein
MHDAQHQGRLWPLWAGLALLLAISLGLGACGGGGDSGDDEEQPTATSALPDEDEPDDDATVEAEIQTIDVDQTFWHAGWKVTLGEATLTPGRNGGTVTIEAEFENLGDDQARFDSQLVLLAGGENYTPDSFEEDLPTVPGNLTGNGVIAFRVDEDFSFDDATLVVGNPNNNQAIVPLGPEGDDLVDLAPIQIPVTGSATAGAVTLNVEGVEVRADLPDIHSITEEGKKVMIITFNADVSSGIPIGEGVLQSQNIILRLPDGTAVAVRSDGVSGVNELLQGKEGTRISDLSARFEVPEPVEGQYAFIVRGRYSAAPDPVEGELVFVVEPAGAGASTPAAGSSSGASPTAAATP